MFNLIDQDIPRKKNSKLPNFSIKDNVQDWYGNFQFTSYAIYLKQRVRYSNFNQGEFKFQGC